MFDEHNDDQCDEAMVIHEVSENLGSVMRKLGHKLSNEFLLS